MLGRRTFLASLGVAALRAALPRRSLATELPISYRRIDRVGLQLYTVRGAMGRDLEATLEQVAAIGYREVEFAGYFERPPAALRALLDRLGLAAPSAHIPFTQLEPARWRAVLDDARVLGHGWVTVPSVPGSERRTIDDWKRVAARFNAAAAEAKQAGLRFAYHNHDFEFASIDGVRPFDVLLAETDPALVDIELDLYWIVRAGADPLDYLARFPGRFPMLHVKDSAGPPEHRMVDVGAGSIDFARLLPRFAQAGTTHFFVEHDRPADAAASIRASHAYLAALAL